MSTVWIAHTVIFSKQEVQKGGQRVVAQARMIAHQTIGRRNKCELNFNVLHLK